MVTQSVKETRFHVEHLVEPFERGSVKLLAQGLSGFL